MRAWVSIEETVPEVPSSMPQWQEAQIEYIYHGGSTENAEHKAIALEANEEVSFKTVKIYTSNETLSEETIEVEDGDLRTRLNTFRL